MISLEQYKKLRKQGLSPDQVKNLENKSGGKDWWGAIDKAAKIVSSIFPGKYIGEQIGATIATALVKPEESKYVKFPKLSKIAGDIGQSALMLAAPLTAPAKTIAGRIGFGATIGAGAGLTQTLKEEKPTNIIGKTIGGAVVGAGISGAFELVGIGLRALANSNFAQKLRTSAYNQAIRPSTKELTSQIEKGFKTTGQQIAETGTYKGGYETMRKQAVIQLEQNGTKLNQLLAKYPDVKITPGQVTGNIKANLEEVFGSLDKQQIATIRGEISKIPSNMGLTDLLAQKRLIDKRIDPTFWIEPNERKSFVNWVRFLLRKNMKNIIEISTDSPIVKQLNNNMSLAMDVKHLTSLQQALRARGNTIVPLGRFSFFSELLDKTIFNPAITTRITQGISNLGQKTGQTPLRQVLRAGTIIGIESKLKKE